MNKKQNSVVGATITASLVGILTALLISKKSSASRVNGKPFMQIKKEDDHGNFLLGGLAGGVAGILLSILFAPQSGKDLIKNILRHLQTVEKRVVRTHVPTGIKRTKKKSEPATAPREKKTAPRSLVKKQTMAKKNRLVNI